MKCKSLLIFCFVIIFINACITINKQVNNSVENVLDYCEFTEISKPFKIRILDYIPCSTIDYYISRISCASNCIGITSENDTIRVLSLSNTDSTFTINDTILVIPEEKPNYYVGISQHWIEKNNQFFLPPIQRRKLKTTYGKLQR